ncbi:MAG: amino acid adenylation domain-containing protein [Acidobacteriota bacterium]
MAPAELRRQLDTWNATAMAYPRSGARLHGLVLRQAASTPDLPAVADGSGEWTYAELEARSRRLADRLVDLGVGPGATVGLCLPGGRDAMAAVLGVLRVGGAYVPLDPETPPDRLLRLLNAARCTVLIAGDGTPAPYGYDGELLSIDGSWASLPELAESVDAEVDVPPDAAAYVIFTSGSTGEPKGVVVSHRTVVNLTHGFVDRHGFTEGQRWLVIPPLHFDASVGDLFPALATGGCLVFHPDPGQLTGPTLEAFCETERIAVVDTAAALWKQWVDDWLALGRGDVLPDLDVMMVGGEAVDAERLRAWAGLTGGRVRFFNHYGPTEATVCATLFETRDASGVARSALPMGRPLGNVRVYVVGDDLRPVPTGAGGELVIGGAGVARGYLGEPAKTAEVFVPDPFAREGGARLYRTGDLVRWLPSGDLEFVGRRDRQVKIRGFRIELGEIEALLRRHDSARESVVLAREDLPGQKTLVAYVLRDPEHPADEGELRSYLRERLPAFMVPAALVILDVFPLTPNGKVDLRSLPSPSSSGPEAPAEPRTATEAEVLAVWRDVLGVPDLGVFQDFFELGGSSLLAMRLKIQIDRDLDLDVPLAKLFEATTVADYARVVEELRTGGGGELDLEAEAVLDEAIVPRPGAEPAEGVLLTGGTGFLGGFLLHEILTQMPGPVFVAVRAADVEAGLERIRANLETYGLPADPDRMARVRPVIGDLSKPLLGLGEAAFAELAAAVGQIFHNAASVNFVQPYGPLRPINVGGTEEVLRLAAHGGARPVHFVSTLGVFLTDDNGGRVVDEDRAPTPVGLEDGYNQSKWVAERLVEIARGRGLPANVFRPARVTGSADSGASNTGDLFYSWIKGCLQLGLAPDLDMPMDMLPVDYLAKAIVHLAAVTPAPGRAYHFYNPSTVPFRDLMAFAEGRGHNLDIVPYGRWVKALRAAVESGGDNALSAFLGLFPDEVEGDRQRPTFDQQRSQSLLAAAGLECPPVDTPLLDAYFGFLETVGFLPRPTPIEETR